MKMMTQLTISASKQLKATRFRAGTIALFFVSLGAAAEDARENDAEANARPLVPIASLNLPRYMGTWYEIAKFPNRFQARCAGSAMADYSLNEDGTVRVDNRCISDGGEMEQAVGEARQNGGASSPKFNVRFAPSWLSFIPATWGDYWVIDLDDDYQLAAVSEPERKYLWVLSRTPKVDQQSYAALLERLEKKGFEVGKLDMTRHDD